MLSDVGQKENVNVNFAVTKSLENLSLEEPLKKKQSAKAKYAEKKKKLKNNVNALTTKSHLGKTDSGPGEDAAGSSSVSIYDARDDRQNGKKGVAKATKNNAVIKKPNTAAKQSSVFKLTLTNRDMDICRRTAIELNNIRESIVIDHVLANHLNILAYNAEQHLFEQQHNAYFHQQRAKQREIEAWLSTRSEAERQEYLNRQARPS